MARAAPDPLFVALGATVRAIRRERGYSQEVLAERAQLHRTYVTDVELGRRNVSLYNLRRLATALGVSLTELISEVERREASGPRA